MTYLQPNWNGISVRQPKYMLFAVLQTLFLSPESLYGLTWQNPSAQTKFDMNIWTTDITLDCETDDLSAAIKWIRGPQNDPLVEDAQHYDLYDQSLTLLGSVPKHAKQVLEDRYTCLVGTPPISRTFEVNYVYVDDSHKVTGVKASSYDSDHVKVQWHVTDNSETTDFHIYCESSEMNGRAKNDSIEVSSTSIEHSARCRGLTPGTVYQVYVSRKFINNGAYTSRTDPVTIITKPLTPTIEIKGSTLRTLDVAWTVPSEGQWTYIEISGHDESDLMYSEKFYKENNTGTATLTQLLPGTKITFSPRSVRVYKGMTVNSLLPDTSLGQNIGRTSLDIAKNLDADSSVVSYMTVSWKNPSGLYSSLHLKYLNKLTRVSQQVLVTNKASHRVKVISGHPYEFWTETRKFNFATVSSDTLVVLAPPRAPGDLTCNGISSTSVTLSWSLPVGGEWMGFRILYRPSNATRVKLPKDKTQHRFADLTPGSQYEFIIRSTARHGDIERESSRLTQKCQTKLDGVHGVTVATSTTKIEVLWGHTDGNKDDYLLLCWGKKNISVVVPKMFHTGTCSGATPGQWYNVLVVTRKQNYSDVESSPQGALTVPKPPQKASFDDPTATSVTVSWNPPTLGSFTNYVVEYSPTEQGASPPCPHKLGPSETSITYTNLVPGSKYSVTVFTESTKSVSGVTKTERSIGIELKVNTALDVVRSVNVTNVTTTSISVIWQPAKGNFGYYTLLCVSPKGDEVSSSVLKTRNSERCEDATPGSVYKVSVKTMQGFDEVESGSISVITVPLPPKNVAINYVNSTYVGVEWKPPSQGGYTHTHLTFVQEEILGITAPESMTLQKSQGADAHFEGVSGTKFKIVIYNEFRSDALNSSRRSATVVVKNRTALDSVDNLRLIRTDTETIFVDWHEARGQLDSYLLQCISSSKKVLRSIVLVGSNSGSCKEATPGKLYTVSVLTRRRGFTDVKSASLTAITVPLPPENVAVTFNRATSTFTATWDPPTTGNLTNYDVVLTSSDIGNVSMATVEKSKKRSVSYKELMPGSKFTLTVTAVTKWLDERKTSTAKSVEFKTELKAIGSVKVINRNESTVEVQWTNTTGIKDEYEVRCSTTNHQTKVATHNAYSLSGKCTGLIPGAHYNVTVVTKRSNFTDAKSSVFRTKTALAKVTGVKVVNTTSSDIWVNWNHAQGNLEKYNLVCLDEKGNRMKSEVIDNGGRCYGCVSGRHYRVAVETVLEGFESVKTNEVGVVTGPVTMGNLSLVNGTSTTTIKVTWGNVPPLAGEYEIHCTTHNQADVVARYSKADMYGVCTGLVPGTQFNVTVLTKVGNSVNVKSHEYQTKTALAKVTGVDASNTTTGSVFVTWTDAPGNWEQYNLYCEDENGLSFSSIVSNGGRGNSGECRKCTPGTVYRVTVETVLRGFESVRSKEVDAVTVPLPPKSVAINFVNSTCVVVEWKQPFKGGYTHTHLTFMQEEIRGVTAPASMSLQKSQGANAHFEGVPGTKFKIAIYNEFKSDALKSSKRSATVVINNSTALAKVTRVKLVNTTSSDIWVNWTHAQGNWEKYNLVCLDENGNRMESEVNGNSGRCYGCVSGRYYRVAVETVLKGFESVKTDEVGVVTVPLPPKSVAINFVNSTCVVVEWKQPFKGGYTHTHLTFMQEEIRGVTAPASMTLQKSQGTNAHFEGVPGTKFKIAIYNEFKSDALKSSKRSATVVINNSTALAKVTRVKLVNTTSSDIWVNWTHAQGNWEKYNMVCLDENGNRMESEVNGNSGRCYGCVSGRYYRVAVETVLKGFESVKTDEVGVVTGPVIMGNLSLINGTSATTIKVTWGNVPPLAGEYEIHCTTYNQADVVARYSKADMYGECTGLVPGTQFNVTVVTKVGNTVNVKSHEYQAKTALAKVTGVDASNTTTGSVFVTWTDAQGNWGQYNLHCEDENGRSLNAVVSNGGRGNSGECRKCTPGTVYRVTVETVLHGFESVRSKEVDAVTVPMPPTYSQFSTAPDLVWIAWDPPAQGDVTSYLVEYPSSLSHSQKSPVEVGKYDLLLELKGPGYAKNVSLTLYSKFEHGGQSKTSIGSSCHSQTGVYMVRNVVVNNSASTEIFVSWSKVEGDHDGHTITCQSSQHNTISQKVSATETSGKCAGLTPGVLYEVTVSTFLTGFSAVASRPVVTITDPLPPSDVRAIASNQSISVSWKAPPRGMYTHYVINYDPLVKHATPVPPVVVKKGRKTELIIDYANRGVTYSISIYTTVNYPSGEQRSSLVKVSVTIPEADDIQTKAKRQKSVAPGSDNTLIALVAPLAGVVATLMSAAAGVGIMWKRDRNRRKFNPL